MVEWEQKDQQFQLQALFAGWPVPEKYYVVEIDMSTCI